MKAKIIAVTLAVSLLAAPNLFASSVGNEVEGMGNLKISAGSEWNLVYNKEINTGSRASTGVTATDFEVDYSQLYGKLAVGITDYLNLYTKLGSVKVEEARLKFTDGTEIKIESDPSFLWAVGATIAYTFKSDNKWLNDFFIGINNEFNMWGVDVDNVKVTGYNVTSPAGHIWNWEYQLAGYVGRRFAFDQIKTVIKPYIGMVWDTFHIKDDEEVSYVIGSTKYILTNLSKYNEDPIGLLIGTDVTLFDHVVLNVEGRFITETALTFGGSFKF